MSKFIISHNLIFPFQSDTYNISTLIIIVALKLDQIVMNISLCLLFHAILFGKSHPSLAEAVTVSMYQDLTADKSEELICIFIDPDNTFMDMEQYKEIHTYCSFGTVDESQELSAKVIKLLSNYNPVTSDPRKNII